MSANADRLETTRWLVGHTRSLLPPLAISVVARIVNQLLAVALLVIAAGAVVDAASGQPVSLPTLAAWLIALALVKAGLRYLEHYAGHYVAFTALERLRELFFARLIPLAPAGTRGAAGAELTERASSDIDRIETFYAHTFPPAISALTVPLIALGWLAAAHNPWLALVLAPFILLALWYPFAASDRASGLAGVVAGGRGRVAAELGDDIQGAREVLAFGLQGRRLARLDQVDLDLVDARARAGRANGLRAGVTMAAQSLGLVAVLATGVWLRVEPSALVAALAVAVGLWGPTKSVDGFATSLDAAMAATARIRKVIDGEPRVTDTAHPIPVPAATSGRAAVRLEQVSLNYTGNGRPALDGVSLAFDEGRWSCVVGVSGSGKSSLASLVLRGWDPDAGRVTLHGADVAELALHDLRGAVGLVPQRPTMLSGTLIDNLSLARPGATEDEIAEALRVAALDDWVGGLADGLATRVSERGLNVSGGQLQRLALARALLAAPQVLILDEALSQLDAATAELVRSRLRARPGLTVVEITHRADLIDDDVPTFVLDSGRLVEAGTAGELRALGGAFTHLEARTG